MFLWYLVLNTGIVFVILNASWVFRTVRPPLTARQVVVPLSIGLALTVVDTLRFYLFYKILLFLVLGVALYFLMNQWFGGLKK